LFKLATKSRKLFAFLREHRAAIFDGCGSPDATADHAAFLSWGRSPSA